MVKCDFCGEEPGSKRELHLHWGEEHEEELNSHQGEKVKKAKRKKEEEEQKKIAERKRMAGYGLAGLAALAVLGFVATQFSGGGGAIDIDTSDQPAIGNSNSSVTVVEFGDYRCPACKRFHEQVYPQLKEEYIDTGKIEFVFIGYSFLDEGFPGDTSTTASVAAECVRDQDEEQFWSFHNALYNNQGPESQDWATEEFLISLARDHTSGLDYQELESCIKNRETLNAVEKDRQIGQRAGFRGTPAFFVNGEQVTEWSFSSLKSEIEEQLK